MKSFMVKLEYLLKHNIVFNKIFRFVTSSFFRILGIFIPMDNKAILFSALNKKYNDSPKAIYEYIISRPEFKDFKYYWAVDDKFAEDVKGKAIIVKPDSFKYFVTALKCKYWVACVNIERSLKIKRRKTIYLHTWHGIPIKAIGNEAAGRKDFDFSYVNYFCVSSHYDIVTYKKSFNVDEKQTLKVGMPRNDTLYRTTDEEIVDIKMRLGLPTDKKIVLYAPTWRDSKNGGKSYQIKPPIDLEYWEKELGEDYILLLRTHPYTNELLGVTFNDFVRDYINYPDVNDLLKISDILISDYSGTIFDYSVLERPIICFTYDLEEYSKDRGFALNMKEDLPCKIVEKETEVIDWIKNIDYTYEKEITKRIKAKFIEFGGKATEECVKTMFELK